MQNKIYQYDEPVYSFSGKIVGGIIKEKTENQILQEYWDYWEGKMLEKYKDHPEGLKLITEENCIIDWITINWAWEKKNDNIFHHQV